MGDFGGGEDGGLWGDDLEMILIFVGFQGGEGGVGVVDGRGDGQATEGRREERRGGEELTCMPADAVAEGRV